MERLAQLEEGTRAWISNQFVCLQTDRYICGSGYEQA